MFLNFYHNLSIINKLFGPNRLIDQGDTNFWKKICSILYDAYLFGNYGKYHKKFIRKIVLFFNLTSVYQILCNFIYWMKSCKCLIDTPSAPSLWHQQASGFEFYVGPYFFLISNSKRTSLQNLTLLTAT